MRQFVETRALDALRVARALQSCAAWMALAQTLSALEGSVPREVVQRLAQERRTLRSTLSAVGPSGGKVWLDGRTWDLMEPEAWHLGRVMEQELARMSQDRVRQAKAS